MLMAPTLETHRHRPNEYKLTFDFDILFLDARMYDSTRAK